MYNLQIVRNDKRQAVFFGQSERLMVYPDIAKAVGILSYRRDDYPRATELLKEAAASGRVILKFFTI